MCAELAICSAPARLDFRYRRPSAQSLSCLQRQRLVGEHSLDDDLARFRRVERSGLASRSAESATIWSTSYVIFSFLVAVVALRSMLSLTEG